MSDPLQPPPAPPGAETFTYLTTIRIVLALSAFVLVWFGKNTHNDALLYVGASCIVLLIFARVIAVRLRDRSLAARFADAPMSSEQPALRKQMTLLRRIQIPLIAAGVPLVIADIALGWPQAVGLAASPC